MKNFLFYTIAGSILGMVAHWIGLGLGTVLALSLVAPPLLIIAWIVLRSRDVERKVREEYWLGRK